MPVPHYTETYGLRDVRLRPLILDNANVSAPSYGAPVDVPGVAELSLSPEMESQELLGDDQVIAVRSSVQGFSLECSFRRVSLDVLAVLLGGSVVDGTNEARYDYKQTELPLWRLDGLVEDTMSGLEAVRIVVWKARLTDADLFDAKQQDFGEFSFQGRAFPLEATANTWNRLSVTYIMSDQTIDLGTEP